MQKTLTATTASSDTGAGPLSSRTIRDQRRIASLSLDLDNLWSYLKIHGDSGWEANLCLLGSRPKSVTQSRDLEIAPMGSAVTRMARGLTGKAEDDPAPGVQVRRTTSTAGFRDIRSRPRPIGVISYTTSAGDPAQRG